MGGGGGGGGGGGENLWSEWICTLCMRVCMMYLDTYESRRDGIAGLAMSSRVPAVHYV